MVGRWPGSCLMIRECSLRMYESGGIISMNLPSAMFENVIDVLRNEKPIYVYFAQNRGFLTTSMEPIGEEEG